MRIPLLLGVAATVTAFSATGAVRSTNLSCSEVQIPVTVSETRFILITTIENDWDAVSFTFNLTSRALGNTSDPSPVVGRTDSPVESKYTIGATLCGTGGAMLILTHGIIESKLQVARR